MHYVPRLLLRRFTNDNGHLSVYHKQENRWFHSGVGNAGLENNIYESDVDAWLRDEIESAVGSVLKDMLSGNLSNVQEGLPIVADFIVTQKYRVPAMRTFLDEDPDFLYHRLVETLDELLDSADPAPAELIQQRAVFLEIAKNDPQLLISQIPTLDIPNAALLGGMNSTDWKISDAFMAMAWRLIFAEEEEYILSDNPVSVQNLDEYDPEIVLPISKNCAIHIGIFGSENVLNDSIVCDESVRQINLRTLAGSYRFIFASRESDWVTENAHRESLDYTPIVFDAPKVPGVRIPVIYDCEGQESDI